jgi:multidrug resistance efflux pump
MQVLLRSKALEITAEGCITSALLKEQSGNLQALLNAFTPTADTAAVASSISRLATLLAEDTHSFDTLSAAQRAVHSAVAALKGATEAPDQKRTSLADKLAGIDRQLDHHQAFLNKTAAGGLTK